MHETNKVRGGGGGGGGEKCTFRIFPSRICTRGGGQKHGFLCIHMGDPKWVGWDGWCFTKLSEIRQIGGEN